MGTGVIQPSFTSGELAPSLYGRIDLAKYQTGLKTCKNFIVRQYGGVSNRPGTTLVNEVKDSSKKVRLIPFQFNMVQTYILEFGHLYMRVHKDGASVYSGASPVEIVTPWEEADLPRLSYTQSADVLTVCHPDFAPRQITRTSHTAWTIATFDNKFGPFQEVNATESVTLVSSAVTGTVTITANTDIFSAASVGDLLYIEAMPSSATPAWEVAKVTSNGDIVAAGGRYYKAVSPDVPGVFRITGTTRPTHLEGNAWDGTGLLGAETYREPGTSSNVDAYVGVEWEYLHSGHGIVKITGYTSTKVVTATVVKRLPDSVLTDATYKWAFGAWSATEGYPSATGYHGQRQVFGGTSEQPQTVWMSSVGGYNNFGTSIPVLDDEAITFTLASREVNEIRHFLPLSELILLTSGGEWLIKGDQSGNVLPSTVNAKAQGYGGSSYIPPIVVGSTALYVQDKGSQVRALGYSFEQDAFIGNDLTVLSNHFFRGRTLTDWAYQKIPFSTAWVIRDDGKLLGLTYLREQEVIGWHQHGTDGLFESVASISENNEDAVYFVVNRTIDGSTKRYIERMDNRFYDDVKDMRFLDCALHYDGRNTTATTMTLSGGTLWDHTETLTITASASTFAAGDVGDSIMYEADDITYRLTITAYTSGTVVSAIPNRVIPAEYRSARTDWVFGRNVFAGIDHLEGKTVAILADGSVLAQQVVESGTVTLDRAYGRVHIGLPYDCDFETLPLSVQGQNIRDKMKVIPKVTLLCEESRGVFAGPDANNLFEYKQRATETYDEAITPATGLFEINTAATWDKNGVVFVRQSDPLPLTILAVIPDVTLGGA